MSTAAIVSVGPELMMVSDMAINQRQCSCAAQEKVEEASWSLVSVVVIPSSTVLASSSFG